ncbi:hypothetical protein GEMRC1_007374 [Eukaryota sp. GEM-RC1]
MPSVTDVPECQLLGFFSIALQSIMGLLAFSVLVIYRFREKPRKPWLVWTFDTSKSASAALLQHTLNIILSIFFGDGDNHSSCSLYVVISSADTFLGTFINFLLHTASQSLFVTHLNHSRLKSGFYGPDINRPILGYWLSQMSVWLSIVTITKIILAICISFWLPVVSFFISFLMDPMSKYPRLELTFVMLIVPLF